jgi:ferric-dicitrate binding protein FerR (iron transport regulator)
MTGAASEEDEAALFTWLSESEENKRTFRAMKDAYDLGRFETDMSESRSDSEWQKLLHRIRPEVKQAVQGKRFLRMTMRYAAIFVLGLLCMKLADIFRESPDHDATIAITRIETGKGERTKIFLPDSSVILLNSCSSISYDQSFGEKTRNIELTGEAFFEVYPAKSKPFLISTGDLRFRVTGTSFNICSYDNENTVSLVLEKGGVTFEHDGLSAKIKPGELVEFDKATRQTTRKKVDTGFYTRWRSGELVFEKMTFAELTRKLERNFNVTFVFRNEQMKNVTFGGTFRHYDSLATIMKVISTSTPFRYKIEKDTIYIN